MSKLEKMKKVLEESREAAEKAELEALEESKKEDIKLNPEEEEIEEAEADDSEEEIEESEEIEEAEEIEESDCEDDDEEDDDEEDLDESVSMPEIVDAIFESLEIEPFKANQENFGSLMESSELTEDFKKSAVTIFESAVNTVVADRVSAIKAKLTESLSERDSEYSKKIDEASQEYENFMVANLEEMEQKFTSIAESTAATWLEENKVAVEQTLMSEMNESVVKAVIAALTENHVTLPEESLELVEAYDERMEQLEEAYNKESEKTVELRQKLAESQKELALIKLCEGKTSIQSDKIRSLAESVEYVSEESFNEKMSTLVENFVPKTDTKTSTVSLVEDLGSDIKDSKLNESDNVDPEVRGYLNFMKSESSK